MGIFVRRPDLAVPRGKAPRCALMMVVALALSLAGVASATAGPARAAAIAAGPAIVFDGTPGTGAPPPTLGGYAMQVFGAEPSRPARWSAA